MLVQPISTAKSYATVSFVKAKNPNFKNYDWSKYANHDGSPIPDEELIKYNLSREAERLEGQGRLAEAAEKWLDVAGRCRKGGKERDAYLCETTARKLLQRLR